MACGMAHGYSALANNTAYSLLQPLPIASLSTNVTSLLSRRWTDRPLALPLASASLATAASSVGLFPFNSATSYQKYTNTGFQGAGIIIDIHRHTYYTDTGRNR